VTHNLARAVAMSREGSRSKGGRRRCRHDGARARATSAGARTTRWARSPAGAEAARRARRGGRRTGRRLRRGGGDLALHGGEHLLALTRGPAAEEARLPPWPPVEGGATCGWYCSKFLQPFQTSRMARLA
jgi:hypothetical protein